MKQWMKKSLAACLALVMCLTLAACGGKEGETPAEESVNVRVAALKGPTAMGMVKLMSDYAPVEEALEDKENVVTAGGGNTYEFTLAASADEVSPKLMQGELDIACVPANLASVLYNRTDGGIVTLAVNTLGVLYIVENGNSVQSMADLAGRTIVASGKGSTPEYALRYLLTDHRLEERAQRMRGIPGIRRGHHRHAAPAFRHRGPDPAAGPAGGPGPDRGVGRPGQRLRPAHRRGGGPGRLRERAPGGG